VAECLVSARQRVHAPVLQKTKREGEGGEGENGEKEVGGTERKREKPRKEGRKEGKEREREELFMTDLPAEFL
jgi:hypothetical protein